MFWAKQTLVDLKIEHSFCHYGNSKQLQFFSSFRETYSALIRKKPVFYTCLGDI